MEELTPSLPSQNTPSFAQRVTVAVPYLWLVALFLVPFLIVFKISLSETAIAQPPYTPVLDLAAGWQGFLDFLGGLSFGNYLMLAGDDLYWFSYLKSLKVAALSTVLLVLCGLPIAYAMSRAPRRARTILVLLVMLPFWTSFLIRVYAWINILQRDGLLNQALLWLGIIDRPATWLATDTAVYIGIVYSYLPFMVLPLYASFEKLDRIAAGSRRRSRLPALENIFRRDGAARSARPRRRGAVVLHSDHRRVRHSGSARRVRDDHDRTDAVDGVFRQ